MTGRTVGAAAALLVAAGAAAYALRGGAPAPARATAGPGVGTATVTRRDLVQTASVDGSLGYADPRTVTGNLPGTITSIARSGRRLAAGAALYSVDHRPVVLLRGRLPAWRALGPGVGAGADVRQLEANLVALGYDAGRRITVDGRWTWATTAAVERLQRHEGLVVTGRLELGRIVFAPGARRRVATVSAHTGDAARPGQPVLQTTSDRRIVTAELAADQAQTAHVGDRATIDLPDGASVRARIRSIATVAQRAAGDASQPTLTVTLSLIGGRHVTRLDAAPVSVSLTRARRRHVAAVPLTALVGRPGGGYAVQRLVAGAAELTRVTPGLFADGYVEVSGVRVGTRVAVPR